MKNQQPEPLHVECRELFTQPDSTEKEFALWLEQYASQLDRMADIEHAMSMYEKGLETS